MKKLTYSAMATARLRASKRSYTSLLIGIFLSIFLVSTFVLCVYAVYQCTLDKRYEKVGNVDMVVMENDQLREEDLLALEDYDRLGHAYVMGQVSDSSIHLGYYDETGAELIDLSPVEGRMPEKPGEIAPEASVMEILDVNWAIGQTVELEIIPTDGIAEIRTFTIVGILPERSIYFNKSDHTGVSYFPAILISKDEPGFSSGRMVFHYMMGLKSGTSLSEAMSHFWEKHLRGDLAYAMYGLSISGRQVQFYSLEDIQYTDQDMFNLIAMIGVLASALILSSCVGISGAMEGVLSKRREEIGVLRAIGSTRRQIRRMFGRENLILALMVLPPAIGASCVVTWILAMLMPDRLSFRFRLWMLLPIAVFSMIAILAAGYLPLVRASKLMPMSVIRDTTMLRRSKKVRTKQVFNPQKLISSRQVHLYPSRRIGATLLVALMLLTCGLTVDVMMSVADFSLENHPGFYLSNHRPISIDYIPTYDSAPLSVESIRQIKSLDNVQSIRVDRNLPILLDLPNVPRYVYASDEMNQFGMLDDRAFEEAMSMNQPNLSYYSEKRDADRAEYLDFCKAYGFSGNAFVTSIVTVDLNLENVATLGEYLDQGSIDIDAINEGRAVLMYAPNVWINTFDDGGYATYTGSPDEPPAKDPLWSSELVAWNDTFSAGQTLSMTQLYRTEEGGAVTRHDVSLPICGVITSLPDRIANVWTTNAIITTEKGLENMKLRMDGLRSIAVYVDELTLEEEETLMRKLTNISGRSEHHSVRNQVEMFRKSQENNRQTFLMFGSVLTVFFTVSVGMIVSSATRQLHSQGRTIGMLRAVGADTRTILGCFRGQIRATVWGGFVPIGGLFGIMGLIQLIDSPSRALRNLLETGVMLASLAFLTILCSFICSLILRLRVREIVSKSIIDNIREL